MILVRDVFRLKFGKAKEAVALFKEGNAMSARLAGRPKRRILTDLVGDYYTVVYEGTYESLADWEKAMQPIMGNAEWSAWYAKVPPLIESGHREIFTVVE